MTSVFFKTSSTAPKPLDALAKRKKEVFDALVNTNSIVTKLQLDRKSIADRYDQIKGFLDDFADLKARAPGLAIPEEIQSAAENLQLAVFEIDQEKHLKKLQKHADSIENKECVDVTEIQKALDNFAAFKAKAGGNFNVMHEVEQSLYTYVDRRNYVVWMQHMRVDPSLIEQFQLETDMLYDKLEKARAIRNTVQNRLNSSPYVIPGSMQKDQDKLRAAQDAVFAANNTWHACDTEYARLCAAHQAQNPEWNYWFDAGRDTYLKVRAQWRVLEQQYPIPTNIAKIPFNYPVTTGIAAGAALLLGFPFSIPFTVGTYIPSYIPVIGRFSSPLMYLGLQTTLGIGTTLKNTLGEPGTITKRNLTKSAVSCLRQTIGGLPNEIRDIRQASKWGYNKLQTWWNSTATPTPAPTATPTQTQRTTSPWAS